MHSLLSLADKPKFVAPLDPDFAPASLVSRGFERAVAESGGVPYVLGLERADGSVSVWRTRVFDPSHPNFEANIPYIERALKFLLWQRGGWKVYAGGPEQIGQYLKQVYQSGAERGFDSDFMGGVYEHPFTVEIVSAEDVPAERESSIPLGRHLDGCRVGFDLGASDRKASAVIDGEVVFSEEVVWDPRPQTDPNYHYEGVVDSIRRAAAHLPHLDAVGGSAAGVYINNRARVASLYRGVPKDQFDSDIAGMFVRIGQELAVPMEVVNDGEVTALAGSMSLEDNPVLGIAMGSSQAGGYVNASGNITGWLNELAFAPIDYRFGAPVDEWSGDAGCGVQYFSQVGAVRVAEGAGLDLGGGGFPVRLEALQEKMAAGDETAVKVYETLGVYLGYALAHYASFYELKHILILGRVTTGKGGDVMIDTAKTVLDTEFPHLASKIFASLPDEKARRVGQSIAAASLPALN